MEPDLIQNSQVHHNNIEEFGPKFKKLRITDNVRELQTVLRDKWVLPVIKIYDCCHNGNMHFFCPSL